MKRKGIKKPIMYWSVIDPSKPYQNGFKRYNLKITKYKCSTEKYNILT